MTRLSERRELCYLLAMLDVELRPATE